MNIYAFQRLPFRFRLYLMEFYIGQKCCYLLEFVYIKVTRNISIDAICPEVTKYMKAV